MRLASPRAFASVAGFFYLVTFVAAVPFLLADNLIVTNNPAATATNILSHPSLFWLGFTGNLLGSASYVVVTGMLFRLFAPVNKTVSLVAAFFSLAGCAIGVVGYVFYFAPSLLLGGAHYLNVFAPAQLQALAFLLLKFAGRGINVSLVFFGFYCSLIGYLTFRSTFMPKTIGVLMAIAGLGWLTFLWPPLSTVAASYVMLTGLLGEGSLTLWLLIFGVNSERWNEQLKATDSLGTGGS
ncbi:MAG: DUF4386 domain-containing protein [Candidatus Eremiobacteraeota bacterium]|nr:DUF4386 domain-containing protein [Candidatus Eremiobacteraeota bacterium]